jgi:hypothetical protein
MRSARRCDCPLSGFVVRQLGVGPGMTTDRFLTQSCGPDVRAELKELVRTIKPECPRG